MSSRSARSVVAWCLVAVAGLGVGAVTSVGSTSAGAQDQPTAEEVRHGEELFTRHCAQCHAIRPGAEAPAPDLRLTSIAYADLVLRTGRMPPGDPEGRTKGAIRYTPEQRGALMAFLTERFDLDGEVDDPPPGEAARGREVFATHCAACHGATGAGGVAGGGAITPSLVGLEPLTLAQAVRVGPFEMPRFSPDQISDEEVGDIAAFMDEVADEPGTLIGLAELNPVFASAYVFVLAVVVVVSCMWITGRVQLFPGTDEEGDDG